MSAARRMPSLGTGIAAAAVLSACGAALFAALTPWLGSGTALRLGVAALGFGYALYLIARSGERVGRLTTLAGWAAVASVVWLAGLPLAGYVLAHLGLVWLVRSASEVSASSIPTRPPRSRMRSRAGTRWW